AAVGDPDGLPGPRIRLPSRSPAVADAVELRADEPRPAVPRRSPPAAGDPYRRRRDRGLTAGAPPPQPRLHARPRPGLAVDPQPPRARRHPLRLGTPAADLPPAGLPAPVCDRRRDPGLPPRPPGPNLAPGPAGARARVAPLGRHRRLAAFPRGCGAPPGAAADDPRRQLHEPLHRAAQARPGGAVADDPGDRRRTRLAAPDGLRAPATA